VVAAAALGWCGMTLSVAELELCHLCACFTAGVVNGDCIDISTRRAILPLLERLTTEAAEASRSRHRVVGDIGNHARELDHPADVPTPGPIEPDESITGAQAAAILGLSKRQVLRKAQVLEGEMFGNSYVFKRSVVLAYKEAIGK
jgi:hypothetical protein